METMGPEYSMKPGETVHNTEIWKITDKAVGLDDPEKLLQQI